MLNPEIYRKAAGLKAKKTLCKEIAAWCRASTGDIVITYFGEDEPKIECSAADHERIVLVDGKEADLLYIEHQGVKIYRTTNDCETYSVCWFSVIRGQSGDAEGAFDIRDLPEVPARAGARLRKVFGLDDDKITVAYAIEQGKICLDALG